MTDQTLVPVVESSQVGAARRIASRFAELAALGKTEQGKVAIIATELANNLVQHAQNGCILVQIVQTPRGDAVEMISLDSGPGIEDVDRCLQDGFSTRGTSGNGLGAIRRLSSQFDIYSIPSVGTAILATVSPDSAKSTTGVPFVIGSISIALPGESVCGDAWKARHTEHELCLMVADGLGHGPLAQDAALAAIHSLDRQVSKQPSQVLQSAHKALQGTRGAAVAVATLDLRESHLRYAGIGNISGSLRSATRSQGLVSHNGILGVQLPKIQEFTYARPENGTLIMHSDGLQTRWSLDDQPSLLSRHPAIIAGVLFRDYRRGRDDATIVVVQFQFSEGVSKHG